MDIRFLLTILMTLTLTGCWPFYQSSESRASPTYVSELRITGVTFLARHVNPTFASPGCSNDDLYIGKLEGNEFYFSPPLDLSDSNQLSELISDENLGIGITDQNYWEPFSYNFIRESATEFSTIAGTTFDVYDQFGDAEVPNTYNQSVQIVHASNGPRPEFMLYGNYYLRAFPISIPVNATHIELWFNSSREAAADLVHRVSLENLYSWQNFVNPYIVTIDGNAFCRTVTS